MRYSNLLIFSHKNLRANRKFLVQTLKNQQKATLIG